MNTFSEDSRLYSSKMWKQQIQFELQGESYNTMLTTTNEGITIPPFCHVDTVSALENTPKNTTEFGKEIIIEKEQTANKEAIHFITKKKDSTLFFKAKKTFDFQELFKELLNKNIVFHFQFSFLSTDFIAELSQFLKDEKVFFNIDVIGHLARTGNGYTSLKNDFSFIEKLFSQIDKKHTLLSIQANNYQNSGANSVQQIAYSLAHANEYFVKYGTNIPQIAFHFSIGSHYFMEIAKLKAFRLLWKSFTEEYNSKTQAIIIAKPSKRQQSFAPKFNDFRQKTMSKSAVLGGADYVITDTYKKYTLNIDSNSYFIDYLTNEITKKALELFQLIEKSGGFLQQLKKGTIQKKIRENAQKETISLEQKRREYSFLVPIEKNKKVLKKGSKTLFEPILQKPLL